MSEEYSGDILWKIQHFRLPAQTTEGASREATLTFAHRLPLGPALEALEALALVATRQVHALASLATGVWLVALVDIWETQTHV